MNEDLERKINRARELVLTSKHISVATVNEDGSPHNTPLRFVYDSNLEHIYWGSHPESIHSLNITRTGQIFAVLFDRIERGGLFMKCVDAHMLEGAELEQALAIHNEFRVKEGSSPLTLEYYTGGSPQRMWGAKITNFWVNYSEKGPDGHLSKDSRWEITAKDILGS